MDTTIISLNRGELPEHQIREQINSFHSLMKSGRGTLKDAQYLEELLDQLSYIKKIKNRFSEQEI